jgi:hypothetical protein
MLPEPRFVLRSWRLPIFDLVDERRRQIARFQNGKYRLPQILFLQLYIHEREFAGFHLLFIFRA